MDVFDKAVTDPRFHEKKDGHPTIRPTGPWANKKLLISMNNGIASK